MPRFLIVDDDRDRHTLFDLLLAEFSGTVDHARSNEEAIVMLRDARCPPISVTTREDGTRDIKEPPGYDYDIIFLDHDNEFGRDFIGLAHWIRDCEPHFYSSRAPLFVVHSLNPDGAKNIESILRGVELDVVRIEFGSCRMNHKTIAELLKL